MGAFICEKCGCIDNTACANNYWHAWRNKVHKKQSDPEVSMYTPEFAYYEDHLCCSDCCNGVEYKDHSSKMRPGSADTFKKVHWSKIGKETLLEMESRHDGSMSNATEYFVEHGDEIPEEILKEEENKMGRFEKSACEI